LKKKAIKILKIEEVEINSKQLRNLVITFESDMLTLTKIELMKKEKLSNNQQSQIRVISNKPISQLKINYNPSENEVIEYPYEYNKMIHTEFERKSGEDGLVFTNKEVIEKQRAVMGYLIKKIGLNIIKGKSIMNISLPINIFDVRSHLEVFAYQNSYAKAFLEKAGKVRDPLERLKLTTTFAMTTVHMAVAQLKPFNPILGETFQSKINDCQFYLEQTSHHPPIFNFYIIGENFKIYGYNESEVSTGANSVKAIYKGKFTVEYKDGVKHEISFPMFKLSGTLMRERKLKYKETMMVADRKNDLIASIDMEPDDRGFFSKVFSKGNAYPDYFRGLVTKISNNAKYVKENNNFSVIDVKKNVICPIEGEFSTYIKFGNDVYWEYSKYLCPPMKRMKYTLPSDSTFREDILFLKLKDEILSQKWKVLLEELQRNDRKLREENQKI